MTRVATRRADDLRAGDHIKHKGAITRVRKVIIGPSIADGPYYGIVPHGKVAVYFNDGKPIAMPADRMLDVS
jgi:hypothetical protein